MAEAIPALEQQLKLEPRSPETYSRLANAYWLLDQNKKAETAIEKALELRRNHAPDHYLAGRIYSERVSAVSIFRKMAYARKIRQSFERSIEINPQFIPGYLASVMYYTAAPGLAGGSSDKALILAKQLAAIDPIAGLRAHALIAISENHLDDAATYLDQALKQSPNHINVLYNRAILSIQKEQYAQAVALLKKALAAHATNEMERESQLGSLYQLGKAASESGNWLNEGESALQRYLNTGNFKNAAQRAWVYYRLGLIQEKKGHRKKALEYYQLARAEEQDDGRLDDLLDEKKV